MVRQGCAGPTVQPSLSNTSLLCATETERLQALGTINYLGKEKVAKLIRERSSATGLRTASRSQGGVEERTQGVVTCQGGRDCDLLLTAILNTEESSRETIDAKCFATEELTFSLSYCGERVW